MKKVKLFKLLTIFMFVLLVIALPTVCAFIPYNEPVFVDKEGVFDIAYDQENDVGYVLGRLDNPCMISISELEFKLVFEDETETVIHTTNVKVKLDIGWFGRKEFIQEIDLGAVKGTSEFYFTATDIYYTYTKLGAYWYYMIGLVLFCLITFLYSKQKFYFDIGSDKVEIYATMSRTVIIVNGEIVADKVHKGQEGELTYKLGEENEIKVEVSRPMTAPNIKIKVNGKEPEFTKVKQNCFLKVQDKKKKGVI